MILQACGSYGSYNLRIPSVEVGFRLQGMTGMAFLCAACGLANLKPANCSGYEAVAECFAEAGLNLLGHVPSLGKQLRM